MKNLVKGLILGVMLSCVNAGASRVIVAEEIPFKSVEFDGLQFNYRFNGLLFDIRVRCRTTGWIGVGFDPELSMKGANIIIGYVDKSGLHISDDYGTDLGEHQPDVELGGTDDILNAKGFEKAGYTELQFSIPTDSKDAYDKPLKEGESHLILLACGRNGGDNFTSKHDRVIMTRLDL